MGSLWFVFKSFVLTLMIIMVLQLRFGETSLEQKLTVHAKNSGLIGTAQTMAEGVARITGDGWRNFVSFVNRIFRWESSDRKISIERSRAYLKEQTEKARAEARRQWDSHRPSSTD
jgi:hypothetical protein